MRRSHARNPALRAADSPAPPAVTKPLGVPARSPAEDWGRQDRVTKLSGRQAFAYYRDMLNSHGLCSTLINMLVLPLRALGRAFEVEPGGDSAADQEAADMVQSGLAGMARPWDAILRSAASCIPLGVSVLEKSWEPRDGYLMPRDLAYRPPESIDRWTWEGDSVDPGIEQSGYDAQGNYQTAIRIPAQNLLIFSPDGEGPWGNPLLRRMWPGYYANDHLRKQSLIAAERFASPIPKATEPMGASDSDRTRVSDDLKSLRTGAYASIIQPPMWEIDTFGGELPAGGFLLQMLNYTDQDLARVAFAAFLLLGTTATGGRSVGETLLSIYETALDGYLQFMLDVFQRSLLPQWCDYNFPGLTGYPKLSAKRASELLNLTGHLTAISQLVQSGSLSHELDLENQVRDSLGLPHLEELPEPPVPTVPSPPPPPPGAGRSSEHSPADEDSASASLTAADLGRLRPTPRERDFGIPALRVTLDSRSEMLGGQMRSLIGSMFEEVAGRLRNVIESACADDATPQDLANLEGALSRLTWPQAVEFQALLREQLVEILGAGAEACAAQTGSPPNESLLAEVRAQAESRAVRLADYGLSQITFAVTEGISRDVTGGLAAEQVLRNLRIALQGRATTLFGEGGELAQVSDDHLAAFAAGYNALASRSGESQEA